MGAVHLCSHGKVAHLGPRLPDTRVERVAVVEQICLHCSAVVHRLKAETLERH